mmetsp:Transcript_93826/g.292103  ORF Transcript_93826/g.292103 Transcript_93826/m.292103 type:complete len:509 (+) Transcript_93826:159-1685(+)
MVATASAARSDRAHFVERGHLERSSFGERSPFNERFAKLIWGHWLDSIGNSIIVSKCAEEEDELTAVLTPLIDHPEARDRVLTIRHSKLRNWRCGNANLEWADEQQQRLVWVTDDGRRSVWSRTVDVPEGTTASGSAFPWLLNNTVPEPWLPLDVPRDILYDGARVAALLDIRQMIGPRSEPQERLTHILMDHDLHANRGDYLIPGAESPLWQTLPVSDSLRRSIAQRIHRIPHEALSQRVSWSGESEVWVGHHKISCRARDIAALESRWVLPPKDERKPLEIARLLALYNVFDNPLSNRRSGVHLGLDPELRRQCDYELFASPLNAAVSNGRFASKWPHIEWRFGSIGAYPSVLSFLPVNSIVCVNPPFTEAYLADVMARLAELKLRFRLRIAVPIQEVPWRKKLQSSLPSAQLLKTYYDASSENQTDVLHPTLLWEDPRCPLRQQLQAAAPCFSKVLLLCSPLPPLCGAAAAGSLGGVCVPLAVLVQRSQVPEDGAGARPPEHAHD